MLGPESRNMKLMYTQCLRREWIRCLTNHYKIKIIIIMSKKILVAFLERSFHSYFNKIGTIFMIK